MKTFAALAFTPAVQALQEQHGSRDGYARMQRNDARGDGLGPRETEYLAAADSFFLASVSETGWPYVQHRGGPRGFLKVISPSQLAFADFRGNRQFVTAGNTSRENRVALIVMDYAHRRRLKVLGHLRFAPVADAAPDLVRAVDLPGYRATVERIGILDVAAIDWNCPQHIVPRFTVEEIEHAARPLHARIARLEAEVADLRGRLGMGAGEVRA